MSLTQEQKLARTSAILQMLHGEVRFCLESWEFFRVSSQSQAFLDVFNQARAGYLYDHIAQSIAHKVISSLVSFFDKSNSYDIFGVGHFDEKASLSNLARALDDRPFKAELIRDARRWPGPGCAKNGQIWRNYESLFLTAVNETSQSEEFKRIKKFRNWYIGHRMYVGINFPLPKIVEVEAILIKCKRAYEAAELIFNGRSTDLQDVIDWSRRDTNYLASGLKFEEPEDS